MGWFWNIRELPEMPHAGHLTQVLAQHEFQEAFKNYRDLRFLRATSQSGSDNLGVFRDMLANRRKAYAERLPQVRARRERDRIDALQQRATAAAELTRPRASRRRALRRREGARLLSAWPRAGGAEAARRRPEIAARRTCAGSPPAC
jgi:hypothetical protein